MRTPLFAAVLGLSLVGCLVGDEGTPGTTGGGDPNGTGSGSGTGTGSGSGSGTGSNPVPKLAMSVDKPTVPTELLSTNMVTVTLQGSGGFAGSVGLTASVVDPAAGTPITGWTVALDKSTVDVAADGTATAVATLTIPSQSTLLAGSIKIEATAPGQTVPPAMSNVTVAKQLSLPMILAGTTCAQDTNKALTISQGTKVVWKNGDAAKRITIHIQSGGGTQGISGFAHEPDPGMTPTTGTYEQTANGTGTITWYCHAPGTDNNRYTITAVP